MINIKDEDLKIVMLDGAQPKKLYIDSNGFEHIVKFPSTKRLIDYSCVCEYIVFKLSKLFGVACQEVFLAKVKEDVVCVCKKFSRPIHSFRDLDNSSLYGSIDNNSNADILEVFNILISYKYDHTNKEVLLLSFLKMLALDVFVGNADRHFGNWGLLGVPKYTYGMSPMFDNGNSLYLNSTDKNIKKFLKLS